MTNETNYKPCRFKCNGATKDFPFEFQVHKNNELFVKLIDTETNVATLLVEGADYSARLEAVGGNVTTKTPYSDKYEIVNCGVYWLQGESDTGMAAEKYTQCFMAMWNDLKAVGMEYLAFLR